MLKKYEKFRMLDENKEKDWFVEVNWDLNDQRSKDCKLLKITHPNGDTSFLKKELLLQLLFVIGTLEEQQKMIPQKVLTTRHYRFLANVKAKKDIAKGEDVIFPVEIALPTMEEEIIGELQKKAKKVGSNLVIPRPL